MKEISFILNGNAVSTPAGAGERLVDLLRLRLGCTEVKEGCGEGECGACTVLLDGTPAASCILFAWQVEGRTVTTVRGIDEAQLARIRDAMTSAGAVQCGFCTPGLVLSIKALLDHNPAPGRTDIMEALSGNLCRCTGYEKVARAVADLRFPISDFRLDPTQKECRCEKPHSGRESSRREGGDGCVVGAALPRVDAREKIEGTALYVDDLRFPGLLECALVVSPFPHAEIVSVDVSPALAVPGVVRVLTAADVPGRNQIGCVFQDQPLLAFEKVRFVGDRVAVVVAESREAARAGAARVKVEYRELESLHDAKAALDSRVSIHEGGNLAAHQKVRHGRGLDALQGCDVVLEKEFQVNYQEHAYLEPQGALAVPGNGEIVIHGSMQCPYYVQSGVARMLGCDRNGVRVIQSTTGGAFGGKEDYPTEMAGVAALAAVATGRPARLVYSRAEDIQLSTKRHRMRLLYRVGAGRDGRLKALHATVWVDAGGYVGLSTVVAERANVTAAGPYLFPDAHVDTYIVYTNNLFGGAFRGFGNPQVTFAMETMMDMLADRLGIDRAEVRRINLLEEGQETITGQPVPPSAPARLVLERLVEEGGYREMLKEAEDFNRTSRWTRKGVGLAMSMYGCCLAAGGQHLEGSGALVQVRADGSVEVNIGGTEMGQGAFTVMAQVAAQTLGADYSKVRVLPTDTRMVPDSGPTVASRTTVMSGNAVRGACLQLRSRLVEVAGSMLGVAGSDVAVEGGKYSAKSRDVPFSQLCGEAFRRKINLFASGWYAPPPKPWDPQTGQGTAYVVYCFTGHLALCEVDLVGGLVRVEKLFAVHDVGKAVNPGMLEGQAHGGMVQGMGWALSENLVVEKGKVASPGFTDYLIPSSLDMPLMEVRFVEDPYPEGPFGAKGIGEPSLISVPAAVACAVGHACSTLPDRLPVMPETILRWLDDRAENSSK